MALDPTAREANIRDSLVKFFVDNLKTTEGIDLLFDVEFSTPDLIEKTINRWVVINLDVIDLHLGSISVRITCCTRKDPEGFRLSQLKDTVMGYLSDTEMTDTMKRIPFYRSSLTEAWVLLGAFVVQRVEETGQLRGPDGTKFKELLCQLRWGTKI